MKKAGDRQGKYGAQIQLKSILLLVFLSGCTSMLLPQQLTGSQLNLETKGGIFSERAYHFAKWSVTDVDRSKLRKTANSGSDFLSTDFNLEKRQQYRFTLHEATAEKYHVACAINYSASGVVLGAFTVQRDSLLLTCGFKDPKSGALVGRLVCQMGRPGLVGNATFGKEEFNVHAEFNSPSMSVIKPPSAYGYVVNRDLSPIAAIQLTNDRRIWMDKALPTAIASNTAAVLMAMAYYVNLKP